MHQSFVDETHHAQQADTRRAERQREAHARMAAQGSHHRKAVRRKGLGDVHGLDHQQVVEKGDDGVHQREEHKPNTTLGAKAAAKIKNLEKKPANGGMPPNENRANVSTSVRRGFVR